MTDEFLLIYALRDFLKKRGFDGLFWESETRKNMRCSCLVEHLGLCDEFGLEDCIPGYLAIDAPKGCSDWFAIKEAFIVGHKGANFDGLWPGCSMDDCEKCHTDA